MLEGRRSTREFGSRPLNTAQLARVAWAAQGRTADGRRTCPSAHALYPLTLTVVAGNMDDLAAGAYRYDAERQVLTLVAEGDHRDRVAATTLADHAWLRRAAALLLLSGDVDAAARHFADQPPLGQRGPRYVWLEAGHAGQNIYLQATEAGLGAVLVAGFDDERLLGLRPAVVPSGQHPLALFGLGHPAGGQG
ncbi:SagB/ThcOx family dehydrogenase [Streptomyces coffeae]|uniref:SagB/ThcOx family dehydrogenase n=1 Tax=Streptomyces coffeae TaxID=621382 RepID=A0ABS1NQY5_9ACTN|nr:SagB/ThcOx family dehydrogenase [Streptomyces coffeae]MBL1102511.1 SagB/ThcOx family dehydrogenase [Streptomyces coffeae]